MRIYIHRRRHQPSPLTRTSHARTRAGLVSDRLARGSESRRSSRRKPNSKLFLYTVRTVYSTPNAPHATALSHTRRKPSLGPSERVNTAPLPLRRASLHASECPVDRWLGLSQLIN